MMYFILKYLHVVGAAVSLGTGAGIAFFMLAAHLGGKPSVIAGVARIVVIADFIFTATAVVVQAVTGSLLFLNVGYSFGTDGSFGRSCCMSLRARCGCRSSGCKCG